MSDSSLSSFRIEILAGVQAAHRGLELADSRIGAGEISPKEGRDVVTASDVAVEELVRRLLHESVGQPVVGEEQGGARPTDGSGYWLVDPICGTRNYASGLPVYCLNLAFIEGNEVVAAIVAAPSPAEIVIAERDRGAWLVNGDQLHRTTVSAVSQTIVLEDDKVEGARRTRAAAFSAAAISADRWDMRSFGTTLSLAYLAAGRIAACALLSTSAVHSAAGSLLVAEAGAVLTDIDGHAWTLASSTMLASANQALHDELLALSASAGSA